MPAPVLETAVCPLCDSPGEPRYVQRDLYCGLEGEFGQNFCAACDLYFLSPRVPESDVGRYYPESYGPYRAQPTSGLLYRVAGAFAMPQRRRRVVERFVSGGRILDAGCGSGDFLRALDGARWQRFGVDLSRPDDTPFPGEFHAGRFDGEPPPLENLDAITLWHVFEHLYHPEKAIANAAALLRPGGFLFVAIPDRTSVERWLFGKHWIGWDPPRHVATYSARAMERLLAKCNVHLRAILPDATGDVWSHNVDWALRARGISSRLHPSLALRALFSPLAFVLNRIGLSSAKVYVAQK